MYRRPRHRTVLPGSNLSEAAIGVAIRSCPGVQPRRSYSRLHAIIADSASFANSADRFANNFASDSSSGNTIRSCLTRQVRADLWVRGPKGGPQMAGIVRVIMFQLFQSLFKVIGITG